MVLFAGCTLREGMSTPMVIPSNFISSVPATEDVESVRPGDNKQWTVPKASKPELLIQLVAAGEEGVPLGRLVVKGDMPGATVFVKPSEDKEFQPLETAEDGEPKVRSMYRPCNPSEDSTFKHFVGELLLAL